MVQSLMCTTIPILTSTCPDGTVMNRFDSNGKLICKNISIVSENILIEKESENKCAKTVEACCPSDYERTACSDGLAKGTHCCENVDTTTGIFCSKSIIWARASCQKTSLIYN